MVTYDFDLVIACNELQINILSKRIVSAIGTSSFNPIDSKKITKRSILVLRIYFFPRCDIDKVTKGTYLVMNNLVGLDLFVWPGRDA